MNDLGFYKKDGTQILYAPNIVEGPNYMLTIEDKDNYSYPVDGWIYATSLDNAINIFAGLQNGSGENCFEVIPEGFFLSTDDVSRNAFTQMTTLIQEALSLGFIDNNTLQTITDSQSRKQTLTTLRFRQIMIQYGFYYKNLWDNY
jgi:hypothetical protein